MTTIEHPATQEVNRVMIQYKRDENTSIGRITTEGGYFFTGTLAEIVAEVERNQALPGTIYARARW